MFDNVSTQQRTAMLLNAILRVLSTSGIVLSTGTSSGTTPTPASPITWETIAGNSKELTYYAGVEAGNPSGNTNNVKTVVFKTGGTTVLTQTITYNAADNVLTITAA